MKTARKLIALLMALSMIMALAITANAANTRDDDDIGSIEITNADEEKTYTAYRLFDISYEQTGGVYGVTATDAIHDFIGDDNGVTFEETPVEGVWNVTAVTDAAALAKYIADNFDDLPDEVAAIDMPGGKAEDIAVGYYFVRTNVGSVISITPSDPDGKIVDKEIPQEIHKENNLPDLASVGVGQVLTYTVTGTIPDTTGYTSYTWTISDTMSTGLTFNEDVALTIGETEFDADDLVDAEILTYANNGFTLDLGDSVLAKSVLEDDDIATGDSVTIVYTATVNEAAATVDQVNNTVELEYSTNPADDETNTTDDTVVNHTNNIVITKVALDEDGNETEETLEGAEFILRKANENGGYKYMKYNEAQEAKEAVGNPGDADYVEAQDAVAASVEWVDSQDAATVYVTNGDGEATIIGLEDGEYELIETKAPEGYNLLAEPWDVDVDSENESETRVVQEETIGNAQGIELPSTGGIGTTIFTVVGATLMVGAAVLFVTKKRSIID